MQKEYPGGVPRRSPIQVLPGPMVLDLADLTGCRIFTMVWSYPASTLFHPYFSTISNFQKYFKKNIKMHTKTHTHTYKHTPKHTDTCMHAKYIFIYFKLTEQNAKTQHKNNYWAFT